MGPIKGKLETIREEKEEEEYKGGKIEEWGKEDKCSGSRS